MFVAVEDDAVPVMTKEEHLQLLNADVADDRMRLFWQLIVPSFAFVFAVGVVFITLFYFTDFLK
jgi:hypothetical protein